MNRYQQLLNTGRKIEKRGSQILQFSKRKSVKRWFILTVMVFVALASVPVNAAPTGAGDPSSIKIDGAKSYEMCKLSKEIQGFDGPTSREKDMALVGCGNESTTLLTTVASVAPELMVGGALVVNRNDPGIPKYAKTGIVTMMDQANSALLYNPPTVDLVAHMSSEWVPGQDARQNSVYAQSGYEYLNAVNIADLWGTTRMLAYSLFVIVLIIAGFMIMFRQKIGGQMAVTIFNTIPKVIIGLILVTFSFAIVGIVIDVGVLLINIIGSLLDLSDPIVISNPFSLLGVLFRGENGMGGLSQIFGASALAALFGGLLFLTGIGGVPGALIATGGILSLIIALVLTAIVFYASVKVFITLLKAWVGIIIDTILGPIFLAAAVIPGKSSIGWNWFFRVIKNVLTFVGVFLIINLAGYLYSQDINFFFPSGLAGGDASTGSMGGILGFLMNAVLPLFLFFMAAEVPNFLDDFLPKDGGKGSATAFGNIQKSFSKVPVVGSAFG